MGVTITRKEKMGFGKDVESTLKLLDALDPKIKEAAVAYLNKQSENSPVINTLIQDVVNELQVNPNVELDDIEEISERLYTDLNSIDDLKAAFATEKDMFNNLMANRKFSELSIRSRLLYNMALLEKRIKRLSEKVKNDHIIENPAAASIDLVTTPVEVEVIR